VGGVLLALGVIPAPRAQLGFAMLDNHCLRAHVHIGHLFICITLEIKTVSRRGAAALLLLLQ
jgi:hypothetical protein